MRLKDLIHLPNAKIPKSSLSLSGNFNIPIFHSVKKVYGILYQIGNTLPKRDKLGIHRHIEEISLSLFDDIIHAALISKNENVRKVPYLKETRMKIEKLKHLVRLEHEMKIIYEKHYIRIQSELVIISKMATGWLLSITQNPV